MSSSTSVEPRSSEAQITASDITLKDVVTLRRLTYALMVHQKISKAEAIRRVEELVNSENFARDAYAINDQAVEKIEGEDRWEVGCNFHNEQDITMSGEELGPEHWIERERVENPAIDGVGVNRDLTVAAGLFSSLNELDVFVEKGESEMRRELLMSAYSAIDYLIDEVRTIMTPDNAPIHFVELMKIAIEVQRTYWSEGAVVSKQATIVREIREKYGLTEAKAKAVELVACPWDRTKG